MNARVHCGMVRIFFKETASSVVVAPPAALAAYTGEPQQHRFKPNYEPGREANRVAGY